MNEIIQLADHIYILLGTILNKYDKGVELSDQEKEILSELYIAKEENYLTTIESIKYKPKK